METAGSWLRASRYFLQDLRPAAQSQNEVKAMPRVQPRRTGATARAIDRRHNFSTRFRVGIQRLVPFIGYHHVLMMICVISIVFAALVVAGCSSTSSGLPHIYILSLRSSDHAAEGSGQLEARVGYLGICLTSSSGLQVCSNSITRLLENTGGNTGVELITIASKIKDQVLLSWFLIFGATCIFVTFLLLATFPGWHEERDPRTGSDIDIKPFPSRPVSQVALASAFVASLSLMLTALWQHVAAVTASALVDNLSNGSITVAIGTLSMALAWAAMGIAVVVCVGLLVMILSIHLLDALTED